jgi:hypothetical protein
MDQKVLHDQSEGGRRDHTTQVTHQDFSLCLAPMQLIHGVIPTLSAVSIQSHVLYFILALGGFSLCPDSMYSFNK